MRMILCVEWGALRLCKRSRNARLSRLYASTTSTKSALPSVSGSSNIYREVALGGCCSYDTSECYATEKVRFAKDLSALLSPAPRWWRTGGRAEVLAVALLAYRKNIAKGDSKHTGRNTRRN